MVRHAKKIESLCVNWYEPVFSNLVIFLTLQNLCCYQALLFFCLMILFCKKCENSLVMSTFLLLDSLNCVG